MAHEKLPKKISLRKFAKFIGCTEGAVRLAISEGKISKSVHKDKNGKNTGIDWEAGQLEWANNYSIGNRTESTVADSLQGVPVGDGSADRDIPEVAESKKSLEHYKSELARLELEEKEGILAQVDRVNSQLFSYASEVRIAVQNIPDVCIDEIMATDDRNDAYEIMKAAIDNALTKLTEVIARDFTK